MTWALLFWGCVAAVFWAYAGYPLLAAVLASKLGQTPRSGESCPPLTVVIAARDEEARIGARIADVLAQDYPAGALHVLVVSDGSRDGTARAAADADPRVSVLVLADNVGKAAALNAAMAMVATDLVAFTDVRQRYAPGALRALVAPFADPRVGAVSGELVIDEPDGSATRAVGLYWRMEKRLRADEARLRWLHGVTGAVHALRRALYRPMPAGTILDDMWLPLHAAFAGHWVWMARDAVAHDIASTDAREEFARKLRTLAGNWQLLARLPVLLVPGANPLFFAWWSHKFLRLLVPWALLLALAASAQAPGPLYRVALVAQVAGYGLAALGLWLPRLAARVPLLPAGCTFLMLNAAALLSLPASLAVAPDRLWRRH